MFGGGAGGTGLPASGLRTGRFVGARRLDDTRGAAALKTFHPLGQRRQGDSDVGSGESHQRQIQVDPGVGRLAHGHERLTQEFQRECQSARAQPSCQILRGRPLGGGQVIQGRLQRRQKGVPQPAQNSFPNDARLPPGPRRGICGTEGRRGVGIRHGLQQSGHDIGTVGRPAGGRHGVERREGVARRAAAGGKHVGQIGVGHHQPGVGGHGSDVVLEFGDTEQFEVQVLGAASDRRRHLVRLGGTEHEHHVGGRFLQRLQQSVLGTRREHVHLVEHVHLHPPGRADGDPADELADVVDLVVGGGVQLVQFVRSAPGDGHAGGTPPARLALDEVLAVEGLGQDAGGGRLAGAAGAAEEVGVTHSIGTHGVAQRRHDVGLADDLAESRRAVAQVERLMHHRRRA